MFGYSQIQMCMKTLQMPPVHQRGNRNLASRPYSAMYIPN